MQKLNTKMLGFQYSKDSDHFIISTKAVILAGSQEGMRIISSKAPVCLNGLIDHIQPDIESKRLWP